MRSSSPIFTCFEGLARSAFTSMWPASTSADAIDRVLKKRAAHSHLSSRMRSRFATMVVARQLLMLAVAAAQAPADTVVRRVYRVTPRASSMQRITGALVASRAGVPLDSILALRVLDQRGEEMPGVPVHWTLANAGEGAAVRVVNPITDSLGISRAQFTPGMSADAQSAVAEVAKVGRIAFAATVRATSIRVLPERSVVWSGDDALLDVELRDTAG